MPRESTNRTTCSKVAAKLKETKSKMLATKAVASREQKNKTRAKTLETVEETAYEQLLNKVKSNQKARGEKNAEGTPVKKARKSNTKPVATIMHSEVFQEEDNYIEMDVTGQANEEFPSEDEGDNCPGEDIMIGMAQNNNSANVVPARTEQIQSSSSAQRSTSPLQRNAELMQGDNPNSSTLNLM